MKYGFIKVCAAVPDVKVADCAYNTGCIFECIKKAYNAKAKVVVFPELCITGYTCGDLFLQKTLLDGAKKSVSTLCEMTQNMDILCIVGLPLSVEGKLYNCAAVLYCGNILALIPKMTIPNYSEYYEAR